MLLNILNKKNIKKSKNNYNVQSKGGSLYKFLSKHKTELTTLENSLNQKSHKDIEREINKAKKILLYFEDLVALEKYFYNDLLIIPPKYEFTEFLALAVILSRYSSVCFVYHSWSESLIKYYKKNIKLSGHSNKFTFIHSKQLDVINKIKLKTLNFYEKIGDKPKNFESQFIAYVSESSDIDYAINYILKNSYDFAGLKNTSIKKVVIDEEIKHKFLIKLTKKLGFEEKVNQSKILSTSTKKLFLELISEAISEGGDLIFGNEILTNKDQVQNVVIKNITPQMRIYQKKMYGPILILSFFNSTHESLNKFLPETYSSYKLLTFMSNNHFTKAKNTDNINYLSIIQPLPNRYLNNIEKFYFYELHLQIRTFLDNLNSFLIE